MITVSFSASGLSPRFGHVYQNMAVMATVYSDGKVIIPEDAIYEWIVGGEVVGTGYFYRLTQADVGKSVGLRVLMKDAQDKYTVVAQAPETKLVLDVNDQPSGNSIVILPLPGDRVAGSTLSFNDDLLDPDGRGAVNWQWLADGQPIPGATGARYTLALADLGKDIAVQASYIDGKGAASTWRSDGINRPNSEGIVTFGGEGGPNALVRVDVHDPDVPRDIRYLWDLRDAQGNWTQAPGVTGSELRFEASTTAAHVLLSYADDRGHVEQHGAIVGTGAADDIRADADRLYAGSGNDTVRWGGVYTQRVDGGAGIDLFVAPQAGYHVLQSSGDPRTWWVADALARGQAHLTDVERLQLGSKFLALDTMGAGGQAYRLYQAAFDRTPDTFGLGFWISRLDLGVSLKGVAEAFVSSAEFRTLYGEQPSNAELVNKFYQNVLHRAPDPSSSFWVDVLDRKLATVAEVLVGFSESAENVAALTGVMQHGIEYLPYF